MMPKVPYWWSNGSEKFWWSNQPILHGKDNRVHLSVQLVISHLFLLCHAAGFEWKNIVKSFPVPQYEIYTILCRDFWSTGLDNSKNWIVILWILFYYRVAITKVIAPCVSSHHLAAVGFVVWAHTSGHCELTPNQGNIVSSQYPYRMSRRLGRWCRSVSPSSAEMTI